MLKILNKLAAGDYEFTPGECARLAQSRYFTFFGAARRPDILEKLFAYVPEDKREEKLDHALSAFYYAKEQGPDNTGTLKYLLRKAEEIGVSQAFWEGLVKDDEMFSYVVGTGPVENIDLLIGYYDRFGGREAVLEKIPDGGWGAKDAATLDKMLNLARQWGGEAL